MDLLIVYLLCVLCGSDFPKAYNISVRLLFISFIPVLMKGTFNFRYGFGGYYGKRQNYCKRGKGA